MGHRSIEAKPVQCTAGRTLVAQASLKCGLIDVPAVAIFNDQGVEIDVPEYLEAPTEAATEPADDDGDA